ncbi:hypothetical protein MTY66_46270 [Mycolicibacterium sp. TY66]|nr:hypothetical protein MTY66_46270 [Mycolicibacterium sp. TY66]BCJ79350.1 hypothetical protein MTY81_07230 [Mycolicibacterium sp. TY81]
MASLRHIEDAYRGQPTYCRRRNPPHPTTEKRSNGKACRNGDQRRDDSEPNHINPLHLAVHCRRNTQNRSVQASAPPDRRHKHSCAPHGVPSFGTGNPNRARGVASLSGPLIRTP